MSESLDWAVITDDGGVAYRFGSEREARQDVARGGYPDRVTVAYLPDDWWAR